MPYSCLNKGVFTTDICNGEPEFIFDEEKNHNYNWRCSADPEVCGKCMPFEMCIDLESDIFQKHNVTETVVAITDIVGKKSKGKKETNPNAPKQVGMF